MTWKSIGQSVIGTSHIASGGGCEDALEFASVTNPHSEEVLICCVSDGAGSAKYAEEAAHFVTTEGYRMLAEFVISQGSIKEGDLYEMAENLYQSLAKLAHERNAPLNEFSCTLLGLVLFPEEAAFFQIGDGAIITDDGTDNYVTIWPPANGEYQNTTTFLIDDPHFPNFKCSIVQRSINEVAIFSDGIQLLALNIQNNTVHQPFFNDLFKWLRLADTDEKLAMLSNKLAAYLGGDIINQRTDDDKTLFLSTKLGGWL